MFKLFKTTKTELQSTTPVDYKALDKMKYDIISRLVEKVKEISEKEFAFAKPNINLTKNDLKQLPFNIGDEVILNIYELKYPNKNGWDSGAFCINNKDKSDYTKPEILTIHRIGIDYSLAHEKIENWVEQQNYEQLSKLSDSELFTKYDNSLKNSEFEYWNRYGAYLYAGWHPEITYATRFICSFLKLDSKEGQITEKMWAKEIKIKEEIAKTKAKEQKLKNEWENIYRELANNTKGSWRQKNMQL